MVSNKEMQDLIASVYIPMVFYIPSRVLELSLYGVPDMIEGPTLFDTLFIAKENGGAGLYSEITDSLEIYKKELVFNSNMFKLLEIKERNNVEAFKFLMEKYLAQVRNHKESFEWLYENVEKDLEHVSIIAKRNLEFQKTITQQHLEELEMRFPEFASVRSKRIAEIISKNKAGKIIGVETRPVSSNVKPSIEKPTTQKRKKVVLATDEEVDIYLLKTIFNINVVLNTTKPPK